MNIGALIVQTELEKARYQADALQWLLPPMNWHEMVLKALAENWAGSL